MEMERNWAGNYRYGAAEVLVPETAEQVQEWVAGRPQVKVIGTRHSFNGIADTAGSHLSLHRLNRVLELDPVRRLVTVEAGIRYGELGAYLHRHGYALHNLASLPHISVAGACATATHGSGDGNGNLSTAVHSLEAVMANGETAVFSKDSENGDLEGAVVNLGGLGVVTKLTLEIVPSFQIGQRIYEDLPLGALERHFDEIYSSAYSVSLFTDWKRPVFNQVWLKQVRTGEPEAFTGQPFYGATPAAAALHPVPGLRADNCSEQMGIPGPWHDRLPHFRMDFTPSAGEELQSEYFVPRASAYDALCAIERLRDRIAPLLHVSEIRSVAEDGLWMSPNYRQASIGIHFTWKQDWNAVQRLLPLLEEALAPFQARPHWAKLFTMPPERLKPLYERLPDFQKLLLRCDPEGKFRNAYINRYILD